MKLKYAIYITVFGNVLNCMDTNTGQAKNKKKRIAD